MVCLDCIHDISNSNRIKERMKRVMHECMIETSHAKMHSESCILNHAFLLLSLSLSIRFMHIFFQYICIYVHAFMQEVHHHCVLFFGYYVARDDCSLLALRSTSVRLA